MVDDAQWLDRASAQTLAFVAAGCGRAGGLVFAVREPDERAELAGLPELVVARPGPRTRAALLDSAVDRAARPRVRDRILAEAHGNPLALLELPRG